MNWSRENDFYVFFLSAKAGPFIFLFSGFFHELSHYVFRMRILPIDTHHHYWSSSMESFFYMDSTSYAPSFSLVRSNSLDSLFVEMHDISGIFAPR